MLDVGRSIHFAPPLPSSKIDAAVGAAERVEKAGQDRSWQSATMTARQLGHKTRPQRGNRQKRYDGTSAQTTLGIKSVTLYELFQGEPSDRTDADQSERARSRNRSVESFRIPGRLLPDVSPYRGRVVETKNRPLHRVSAGFKTQHRNRAKPARPGEVLRAWLPRGHARRRRGVSEAASNGRQALEACESLRISLRGPDAHTEASSPERMDSQSGERA